MLRRGSAMFAIAVSNRLPESPTPTRPSRAAQSSARKLSTFVRLRTHRRWSAIVVDFASKRQRAQPC